MTTLSSLFLFPQTFGFRLAERGPIVRGSECNGLVRCWFVDGVDNERLYGALL